MVHKASKPKEKYENFMEENGTFWEVGDYTQHFLCEALFRVTGRKSKEVT
jgi:hypothetical protein